jgi:hypothetical protein
VNVIRSDGLIRLALLVHPERNRCREGGCKTPLLMYSFSTRILVTDTGLADLVENP